MRTVVISNQKGGVGKTTTAVNLASYLSTQHGLQVLLVDMDPQANATSGLGLIPQQIEAGSYHALLGENPELCLHPAPRHTNLTLLPASPDLTGAEIELVSALGREHRLADALKGFSDRFDIAIVDTPPTLGLLTINALTAADDLLIPLQSEYYAMEGLSQLINTVKLVKARLNGHLNILGIVMTMFDSRNNLSSQVEREIRKHFDQQVFKTVVPRNVKLSEAPSHGKPIHDYDPKGRGAKAYADLATEVLGRLRQEHSRPFRPGEMHA